MSSLNIKVGFIGLGVMGKPMALNLIRGRYPLRVHSRRPESMAPLAEDGATPCASPEEAARDADLIVTMVSDTKAIEQVLLGLRGVLAGAKPGSLVVNMGDASPTAIRDIEARLAARGIEMLDAPVSGNETEAIGGALTILAGGKAACFDRARPIFERLGNHIVHVGEIGTGQLAKACDQIVFSLALEGVSEAFTFARKNGVDPERVREALLGGFAGSKALDVQGKRMLERNFQPGFKAHLHQEGLRMILETAHKAGLALPVSALVTQHVNTLVGHGDGDLDSSALVQVIERLNQGR